MDDLAFPLSKRAVVGGRASTLARLLPMCGIAGLFHARTSRPVDPVGLDRMTDSLAHRGPDGRGSWIDGAVGFGHRRLAIIDLEGGRQPMVSTDTGAVITFNGEIYNYRDLRAELAASGVRFRDRSDTEVVLHAVERWGPSAVERLRGMFAFAVWEPSRRRVVAARDRLGIKPFYYRWDGESLFFASELKALVALGAFPIEIDDEALGWYLRLQYVPGPGTIFKGIKQLGAGRTLVCDAGGVTEARYWRAAPRDEPGDSGTRMHGHNGPSGRSDGANEFRAHLGDAVRSHLVSDVPVGAFLSGGIDSSLIVALMAESGAAPIKTFSVGFTGHPSLDERPAARLIADHFRTVHFERLVTDADAAESLPALVKRLDEPNADYALLPTFLVSEIARREVKVVLTGEGADELFGGYRRYRRERLLARMPGLHHLRPAYQATHLFSERAAARLTGRPARTTRKRGPRSLTEVLICDLEGWLVDDLLVKVDRMTMLCSLEARVPYLDHHFVEYALGVPASQKVHLVRGTRKVLMREAAAGLLPAAAARRPKHGFTPPLDAWFAGRLGSLARETLLESAARVRHRLDVREIAPLFQGRAVGSQHGHRIWSLLVYELWCRQYGVA